MFDWKDLQKLYIDPFSTPGGPNWVYFSLYMKRFLRYWEILKITLFGHEAWNLRKVSDVAYHYGTLFLPRGRNWGYFRSTDNVFRDTGRFWKLPYLGMKPGIWKKFHKLNMDPLCSTAFPRYGPIFKITTFGHETWNLKKSSRSCLWINADHHQTYSVASPHGDLPDWQVWSLSEQHVSRYWVNGPVSGKKGKKKPNDDHALFLCRISR